MAKVVSHAWKIIIWFYISLWFYSLYSVSIRIVILSLSDFGEVVSFCQISSQLGQSFCAARGELSHESPDESQDTTWKGRLEKARVEWELLTSECCILELSHEGNNACLQPKFQDKLSPPFISHFTCLILYVHFIKICLTLSL